MRKKGKRRDKKQEGDRDRGRDKEKKNYRNQVVLEIK